MGIEREDVLLIKVRVAKVSIPGNNRVKDSSGVGLSEDLQRCLAVHRRVAHGKEKSGKLNMGIEIPLHLFDGFADLDSVLSHMKNAVKLEDAEDF